MLYMLYIYIYAGSDNRAVHFNFSEIPQSDHGILFNRIKEKQLPACH